MERYSISILVIGALVCGEVLEAAMAIAGSILELYVKRIAREFGVDTPIVISILRNARIAVGDCIDALLEMPPLRSSSVALLVSEIGSSSCRKVCEEVAKCLKVGGIAILFPTMCIEIDRSCEEVCRGLGLEIVILIPFTLEKSFSGCGVVVAKRFR